MMQEKTGIIERLKKRDELALKEVMKMYKNSLLNYLYLMVGNRELAEELTQDTFVKVYFKAGTIKGNSLKPWMYRIAYNLACSSLRKRKWMSLLSLSDIHETEDIAHDPQLEQSMEYEQAIAKLPAHFRSAVIMKDIENLSLDEMSQVLDKPVSTVKSHIHRGRKALRKNLGLQQGATNG